MDSMEAMAHTGLSTPGGFGAIMRVGGIYAARGAALRIAVVAGTACVGAAVPLIAAWLDTASPGKLLITTGIGLGLAILLSASHLSRRDWFFPLALPLTYVTLALMLPVLFVVVTGRGLEGIEPRSASVAVLAVFGLTIVGLAAGSVAGLAISKAPSRRAPERIDHDRMRQLGTATLAAALIIRCYTATARLGLPYGAGSASFSLENALDNASNFLAFLGVILVSLGNAQIRQSLARKRDVILFAAYASATLVSGSRAPLVAPFLFGLWTYHTYVRPIPFLKGLAVALCLTFVFQGVSGVRAGDRFFEGPLPSAERALTSLGTPLVVTHLLTEQVPAIEPFRKGSTYRAALKRQLPGPLAVALFGEPQDTGAFAFRQIIGLNDPNVGLAFALPAEGYLNFGFSGVTGAALLLGLLLGYAYRKQLTPPDRALHVLYPVLVATLPLNLRSDALTQIKTVLYPMIVLTILYRVRSLRVAQSEQHAAEGVVGEAPDFARRAH
jgi:hypothetical protein